MRFLHGTLCLHKLYFCLHIQKSALGIQLPRRLNGQCLLGHLISLFKIVIATTPNSHLRKKESLINSRWLPCWGPYWIWRWLLWSQARFVNFLQDIPGDLGNQFLRIFLGKLPLFCSIAMGDLEVMLRNLTKTINRAAHSAARAIRVQQQFSDSLAQVLVLNNRIAFDYLLAIQEEFLW